MLKNLIALSFFLASAAQAATANPEVLKSRARMFYDRGWNLSTIKQLQELKDHKGYEQLSYYWLGLMHKKMHNYDQAIPAFLKAIELKAQYRDVWYHLGQAYYAKKDLKNAQDSFHNSEQNGFNREESLYYKAYCKKVQGDYTGSNSVLEKMLAEEILNKKIHQVSKHLLAENHFEMDRNKSNAQTLIDSNVIPRYVEALKVDAISDLSDDIREQINSLKAHYSLHSAADKRQQGDGKNLTARFNQSVAYDTNVVFVPDVSKSSATNEESTFYNTSLYTKYKLGTFGGATFDPELKLNNTLYGDRDTANIFQNDAYSMNPALRTAYSHWIGKKQTYLLVDLEYSYNRKDIKQIKNLVFLNESFIFSVGERFQVFGAGETTVKIKYKTTNNFDDSLDSKTYSLNVSQTMTLQNNHILVFTGDFGNTNFVIDSQNTNTLLLRGDYVWPTVKDLTLHPALSLTLTDFYNQKSSKGLEITIAPEVKVQRQFGKNFLPSLAYAYTKNVSKAKATSDYQKHVVTFDLEISY